MNRKMFTLLPVLGVIAVGVNACGADENVASDMPSAAAGGQVLFTSPESGAAIGSMFTAKIDIADFEIDAASVGKKSVDGRGHLHFSLDGGKYDHARYSGVNGKLAEQLGTDGKYSPSVMPQITYSGIPAGEHTLVVELANNNHSDQGAKATTTFTVKGDETAKTGANDEAAASAGNAGATIEMVDLRFVPAALTVERGQTVTFVNRGKVTHNAKGKSFFSRVVEPGGSYRHTFDRAGTFAYVCTLHPGMEGTVTVR